MSENVDELFDTKGHDDEIPISKYGWKVPLDWHPPVKCKPFKFPRLTQVNGFILPAVRYLLYVYRPVKKAGKLPFIDSLNPKTWQPIYGVPMGGIGCGSINRGYKGEFCRNSLIPGIYDYRIMHGNQFIVTIRKRGTTVYQQVLSPLKCPIDEPNLSCWNWRFPASRAAYIGLFPRAWTVFHISEHKLKLFCRQLSPVIAHDYKDTCLPVCLFEWHVVNYSNEVANVSLTLVLENLYDSENMSMKSVDNNCVMLSGTLDDHHHYCLGAKVNGGQINSSYSTSKQYDNTSQLWNHLMNNKSLDNLEPPLQASTSKHNNLIIVSTNIDIEPDHASKPLQYCLAWHSPIVVFKSGNNQSKMYKKRYVRWFPSSTEKGDLFSTTMDLLNYALKNSDSWDHKIALWQQPIIDHIHLPDWFKSAIFNELYYLVDGGTLWLDPIEMGGNGDVNYDNNNNNNACNFDNNLNIDTEALSARQVHKIEYGTFGYLEGHEYRMYNTYDVHFYSSWSLLHLWPKLQESVQLDIADSTANIDSTLIRYIHTGRIEKRSAAFCVPHDMGDPHDLPFTNINAYRMYNTDEWKDLNPKFVLQVYRDWRVLNNDILLRYQFPIVMEVMKLCIPWDKDGDGMIENSGYADQTYDAWTAHGVSAYTGGLWLAALQATCEMASYLKVDCEFLRNMLEKAKRSYEDNLWCGTHYKYDVRSNSIMSDQLCGYWYLRCCDVNDTSSGSGQVFMQERVKKALRTIFDKNCASDIDHGKKNLKIAINGCWMSGNKDISSVQSEEYWVGVNYALASLMLLEGLEEEGWSIAESMYRTIYETFGLQYQTPEAFFGDGRYRSLGYMRPLSIWSIYHAVEKKQEKETQKQ